MSETLRPWVKTYILHHARHNGTSLEPVKDADKKCQIIRFVQLDADRKKDDGAWADISDGEYHITAYFQQETIDDFERNNEDRFLQLRGGLFSVRPRAFIVEPNLALRCDLLAYIGSAGEPTFRAPRSVADDPTIRTWLRAIRGDTSAQDKYQEMVHQTLTEDVRTSIRREFPRGVLAGVDPREHRFSRPQPASKRKRDSPKPAPAPTPQRHPSPTPVQRAREQYATSWGRRTLKMKWYTIPPEQRDELSKIDYPTDDEVFQNQLPLLPPATPRPHFDALDLGITPSSRLEPASSPMGMPPSSLPTQTASSPASTRGTLLDHGNSGDVIDERDPVAEDTDDDDAIVWSPTPSPRRADQASQVILVPNSDPSTNATASQRTHSQTQSEMQTHAQSQLQSGLSNNVSESSKSQHQEQPSLAHVPSRAFDTAPLSSQISGSGVGPSEPKGLDGPDASSQRADVLEDNAGETANESVTASTSSATASQSQSQLQLQPQQSHPPITVLTQDEPDEGNVVGVNASMGIDLSTQPSPKTTHVDSGKAQDAEVDELAMDESDAETEAFLTANTDKKRAREVEIPTVKTPDRKRTRPADEALPPTSAQNVKGTSSPRLVHSTRPKARPATRAKKTIAPALSNNASRTLVQSRSSIMSGSMNAHRIPDADDDDGRQRPPHLTLQNVKDVLHRLGQARERMRRKGSL